MKEYLELVKTVLEKGKIKTDRTGTGTRSIFGYQYRVDLSKGFPLLTTRKMSFNSIKSEILWFLEGSNDERRLAEILYGKPREFLENKKTIWYANANMDDWVDKKKFQGDCGRNYSINWRRWKNYHNIEVDQINRVIDSIKNNPNSRRHVVVGFNPGEIEETCLPACHSMFVFGVYENKLSCHLFCRSTDIPLGLPFNIAGYALLTHMIAHMCDLDVGDLILSLSDAHIYSNQLESMIELIKREPLKLPKLILNKNIKNIDDFKMEDILLEDYKSLEKIEIPFST